MLRGFEQTAEIVAWAIGDGVITPSIPDNDHATLVADYELLTGSPPPVSVTSSASYLLGVEKAQRSGQASGSRVGLGPPQAYASGYEQPTYLLGGVGDLRGHRGGGSRQLGG